MASERRGGTLPLPPLRGARLEATILPANQPRTDRSTVGPCRGWRQGGGVSGTLPQNLWEWRVTRGLCVTVAILVQHLFVFAVGPLGQEQR